MSDPLVAYRDEYPWVRCPCGWMLNSDPGECVGCGREKRGILRRDRFAPLDGGVVLANGTVYVPVPYEDVYRTQSVLEAKTNAANKRVSESFNLSVDLTGLKHQPDGTINTVTRKYVTDVSEFRDKWGTQGAYLLVQKFVDKAPAFYGDDALALMLGEMCADLQSALEALPRTDATLSGDDTAGTPDHNRKS